MEKLEIKKIDKKIELDTQVEGCWNDCYTGKKKWSGYADGLQDDFDCKLLKVYNAKTSWFW